MLLKNVLLPLFILLFLNLSASIDKGPALWNGGYFVTKDQAPNQSTRVIEGDTIYLYMHHFHTYGHGLLDGLLPFFKLLKENNLLDKKINIVLESVIDWSNPSIKNLFQLIRDLFFVDELIWIHSGNKGKKLFFQNLISHEGTPFNKPYLHNNHTFSFYKTCPDSRQYLEELSDLGIKDNIVYQGTPLKENIVAEFINFIKEKYTIDLPMIKNRILYTKRGHPQKIINDTQVLNLLSNLGYDIKTVQFESMSIKEQIIETVQAEYLLGTYGSNLVNAIFLHPEAKVMIVWPEYAKYFWSRKYCIIHSAFLSLGITLIEYDKPNHPYDSYSCQNLHPDFFYRMGTKVRLRENKKTLEAILSYPWAASFELRRADIFLDPYDFVKQITSVR